MRASPFLLLAVLWTSTVTAQRLPQFQHLGSTQGLSFPGIEAIAQDSLGFLWFQNHRWDGEAFRRFEENPDDSLAIAGYVWDAITVSRDGRIWVGTDKGLNVYDYQVGGFRQVSLPHSLEGEHPWIHAIAEAADGSLWLASWGSGVYHYWPSTGTTVQYRSNPSDPASLSDDTTASLVIDDAGVVWVGTETAGLNRYRPDLDGFEVVRAGLCSEKISALAVHPDGDLWVGTVDSGACVRTSEEGTFARVPLDALPHLHVTAIGHDKAGRTWLGTQGGMVLFEGTRALGEFGVVEGLPAADVYTMTTDRTGTVWVATGDGIAYADPRRQQIITLTQDSDGGDTGKVFDVVEWNGAVMVATVSHGLLELDPKDLSYSVRLPASAIRGGTITDLAVQRSGTLWMATNSGLLGLGQDGSRVEIGASARADGLSSPVVLAMTVDHKDQLWLLTDDEVLHRMISPRRFQKWSRSQLVPGSSNDLSWMIGLQESSAEPGVFWISSFRDGAIRFDPGSGDSHRYNRVDSGLSGQAVFSVWTPSADEAWLATGVGLARLRRDSTQAIVDLKEWFAKDGLPSDIVRSIQSSGDGGLFLGSEVGLARFDLGTEEIRAIGPALGASSETYEHRAALRTDAGVLVMAGAGGVSLIEPAALHLDEPGREVRVTQLEVLGEVRLLSPALEILPEVVLPHTDNFVDLSFSGLAIEAPRTLRYRYFLEGEDPEWRPAGDRTTASYSRLDPGDYVFNVEALAASEVVGRTELSIRILPPWWQTVWARGLWVVLVLAAAVSAYRLRVMRLVRRAELLEDEVRDRTADLERARTAAETSAETIAQQAESLRELEKARGRLFANISHEFRTPLTLIEGPLTDAVGSGRADVLLPSRVAQRMLEHARRLGSLVERLLEVARLESNRVVLQLHQDDFYTVVLGIVDGFRGEAERRAVDLRCETDESREVWLDSARLHQVVGNLVSNAIKYTPGGGRIDVRVAEVGGAFQVAVEDSGIGIQEADIEHIFDRYFRSRNEARVQPGVGIGLSLVKDLVEAMGGSVAVISQVGLGSRFTVLLPVWTDPPDVDHVVVSKDASVLFDVSTAPSTSVPALVAASTFGDGQAGSGNLVLVVDDHPDVRAYVRECLQGLAHVSEAASGKEGLSLAEELAPDVVVSDVMMPGMDGFSLVREMRARPELELTPVILLTARAEERDAVLGHQSGADAYVTKPFSASVLRAQVAQLIERQRRQSERLVAPDMPPEDGLGKGSVTRSARQLVIDRIGEVGYGVEHLAADLAVSSRTLTRRLKEESGVSPGVFIRTVKLFHAELLMREEGMGVSQAAEAVGYETTKHFRQHFRRQFGVLPSEV